MIDPGGQRWNRMGSLGPRGQDICEAELCAETECGS